MNANETQKEAQNTQQAEQRPFNLEHAKAGAPVMYGDGTPAEILKFDAEGDYPLVAYSAVPGGGRVMMHMATGKYTSNAGNRDHDLFMAPLGYIDGKPVFAGDVVINCDGNEMVIHASLRNFEGYTWPAPKVECPPSRITGDEIKDIISKSGRQIDAIIEACNLSIQRAIERKDMLLPLAQDDKDHVATVAEVHMSRYTIEWNGRSLPLGTKLYAQQPPAQEQAPDVQPVPKNIRDPWAMATLDERASFESMLTRLNPRFNKAPPDFSHTDGHYDDVEIEFAQWLHGWATDEALKTAGVEEAASPAENDAAVEAAGMAELKRATSRLLKLNDVHEMPADESEALLLCIKLATGRHFLQQKVDKMKAKLVAVDAAPVDASPDGSAEPTYPELRYTPDELSELWEGFNPLSGRDTLQAMANKALKRAIDDGLVELPKKPAGYALITAQGRIVGRSRDGYRLLAWDASEPKNAPHSVKNLFID